MATGIGVPKLNGVGRSALDDRIITRARYHNLGIVMGCKVGTSASGMTYSVGNGTDPASVCVASRGGADGAVEFPVTPGNVSAAAGPSSGSRVDVIWARQLNPDNGDTSNQVILGVTSGSAAATPTTPNAPAGAIVLATYQVPQGASTSSQATLLSTGSLAIPYGASLGQLHSHLDTSNGPIAKTLTTLGVGTFVLPTARRLQIAIAPTLSTPAVTGDGSMMYRIMLDDNYQDFEYNYNRFWSTGYLTYRVTAAAGRHTVRYTRQHRTGLDPVARYGLNDGYVYSGTRFTVDDLGVGA